jgi:hypothetical protein
MRPGSTFSWLGRPRDRAGEDVDAESWHVHQVGGFGASRYALEVGFWWLVPARFGVTEAEIEELSASLSRPGVALEFMRRHFDGDSGFHWAGERGVATTADRVGRRIGVGDSDEYVVVPVGRRGVLVVCASFDLEGRFEREQAWPRILASIRVREEGAPRP